VGLELGRGGRGGQALITYIYSFKKQEGKLNKERQGSSITMFYRYINTSKSNQH
jgi:hypothetical protein